jgi:hypothetical protein
MPHQIDREELRLLIREALREALGAVPRPSQRTGTAVAHEVKSSSSPWGEAESARSAEPGEGSGAGLDDLVPHPVASRLGLSPEGRGGRARRLESGLLTEALVTKLASGHRKIVIGGEVVVTPLARDRARMLKVEIVRQQP